MILHIRVSALLYLATLFIRIACEERMKAKGWELNEQFEPKRERTTLLLYFIPVVNVLITLVVIAIIILPKETIEKWEEKLKH